MGAPHSNYLLPEEHEFTQREGELYRYGTALVVIFYDDSARTLKGVESDGKLVPQYLKECPTELDSTELEHLTSISISPIKLLLFTVKKNRLNGTNYHPLNNNGEHWMEAAVKDIISHSERIPYEECDRVKRKAEIFFYDDKVIEGALVAEFEDGSVRTITKAKKEYRQLNISKKRPPIVRGTKIFRIGSIKTSPHELSVVKRRRRLNDTGLLSVLIPNFQHWTKEAIEAIGLNEPTNGIDFYDFTEQQARFSLYSTTHVDLGSADRSKKGHWALIVKLEDGTVRTLEAFKKNGKLIAKISNEYPFRGSCFEYLLFAMKTSPEKLREVAERNSLNGTDYDAINNNSQHWVVSAIEDILLNLARALPDECDSTEREALFSLFSTPVLLDYILGDANHIKRHWALVAVFEDESVRTLEALKIDGKLAPTFSKEMPSKLLVPKILRFGSMRISPFKLREAAERNRLNGTDYHAVKNNSLHWVEAVIKDIGLNLAKALPHECDHLERQAQFFLQSRPLDDVVWNNGYYLKMQHWALVAVFEDKSVRTLEALNSDRTLTPKYLKQRPSDVDVTKIRHIGSIKIAPYILREVAERNSLNGTDYDAIKNNSQHWVEAAIKNIGLNFARAWLNEYDSTEREAQFFLYTREICDDVFYHSDHLEMRQWALVAIFEDGPVRTLEAIISDRTLTPTFSKERPSELLVTKIRRVGSMRTSPQKLRETARKNSLNGTDYDAIENNSEHWAKEAIKIAIGLKLPRALPEEYDSTVREAQFFLYPKPLNNFVFKHSKELQLQHWSLVAIFEDGSVRTLEAFKSDRKLVPSFSKERPSHVDDNSIRGIGSKKTSPLKLHQVAERNSLNYTRYGPINNNCQNWFKAAVTAISPDLAQVVDNYRTNGEINSLERTGKCLLTSSRFSKNTVASSIKFTRNDLKLSLFQHWKIIVFVFIFFSFFIYVLNNDLLGLQIRLDIDVHQLD